MPRATAIHTSHRYVVLVGDPILDTQEGVLIVQFADGTSRIFNWDKIEDFYHMTEEEHENWLVMQEFQDLFEEDE